MNRRSFFTKSIILGSTLISSLNIPNFVLANPSNKKVLNGPLAGNVFYTENNPGRWSKKVKGHLPTFELDEKILEVTTGHEMRGFEHYIIKHVIFDENLHIIGETVFNPEKDVPISRHNISNYQNTIYALSLCNKHDAWLNSIDI